MYQTGTAQILAAEMKRYQLDILGVSESRWDGSGNIKLATGETILYSGDQSEQPVHERGTAFILSEKAAKSVISWEAVSDRIIQVRFSSNFQNTTVINVYAPTNEADKTAKEEFYEQLQTVIDKAPKKDVLILIGDMNAKVGTDNKGMETIMGKEGLGIKNENGELFREFCHFNNLVIGGTIFKKKNIHKATWVSPNGLVKNQIDHITIRGKWKTSLQDVSVKRGAEVGSDHFLVVAKIKLKLARIRKEIGRRKFNLEKLNEREIRDQFSLKLQNRFDILQEEENLEAQWDIFKRAHIETAREILGHKTQNRKIWITNETWKKIEERREMKNKLLEVKIEDRIQIIRAEYKLKNKEVKKAAKKDKKEYIEKLAQEAEEAAKTYDIRTLYTITKRLGKKSFKNQVAVNNKNGEKLTNEQEQMKRWIEYTRDIFNKINLTSEDLTEESIKLTINTNKITKVEIKEALKTLRLGKAAGVDDLPAELLKVNTQQTIEQLSIILNNIWQQETVPQEWQRGILIKIPKKGDLSKCENWRGITLLSVTSKILTRIMLERLKKSLDKVLRKNQAGFRARRSCTDHIVTLRNIIEQSQEFNTKLYAVFIDFERAFDSLDRNLMWKILETYGIPNKFIKIIKSLYKGYAVHIEHNGKLSEPVEINTGVRQGCILSPTIFLFILDWIMKIAAVNTGITWKVFQQLEDLDFADDICLLSDIQTKMQTKIDKLNNIAAKTGLKININKTKYLTVNEKRNKSFAVNNQDIEKVDKFTYLGSVISEKGGTEEDINARIGKAQNSFSILKTVWNSSSISTKTKLKIFNSNVKSVLLYGAESWRDNKKHISKLQTFINKCLRKIHKIYWPNKITNEELWNRSQELPVHLEI